jgi:hypothetical protein
VGSARGCHLQTHILSHVSELTGTVNKARTGNHIRKLMAPPERNNNLTSRFITHNESMRVRKYIRELITIAKRQTSTETSSTNKNENESSKQERRTRNATHGLHERIPQRARTQELIHGRRVLSESLEFVVRMRRDVPVVRVILQLFRLRRRRRRAAEHW